MELIARSGKLENTRFSINLQEQEVWRVQVHRVNQAWRVYCYSCIPTNFLVNHFTTWRAAKKFFSEFFSFLLDNTSRCYLCVCFSLPYSIHFNCYCFFINYGLECFANLGIAYIYHSAHQLFEYKFCIGKFEFMGLNIHQCFTH